MEAIQALSDAQLRDELIKHGMKNLGPVMGTSRGIYEKKLFKLKQGAVSDKTKTKAEPTPAPASTSKTVKSTSRATRSTKKVVQKSESEDGSDEDIEIISPKKSTSKSSTSKPVSSTPVKDRTPSPPPVPARRKPNRPTNNIIPGLNTTTASSRSTTSNTSRLLIGAPGGDVPGSTPPRRALKTPIRPVTHTSATVTSSYLSPDASFHPSPKFSVQSSITRRGMANLGHTTEEEDSDGAGEETQRTVHNISSTGRDRRSGIRRALDGLLGNNLSAGSRPGDNYELRRGVTRTNVTRDARTGRLSIKQRSVWSDVPRVLLIILTLFLGILLTAYVVASRPDTIAGTVGVLRTAAKDTVEFFYRYAILPVAIVAGGTLLITGIYFAHRYYREKQAKEQVAFEDLVERIIDMVQISSEEGNENITVPHVRDKMYPPAKRSADDLKRWERAVDFINENESRIATECVLIRGQECQVWRWIPYKKSGWQGSAFPETTKSTVEMDKTPMKYLSPNVPTEALTRCLKIRDVRENREGKHADEPVNYDRLKLKVLDKIYPVRPVHFSFDTHSTEGVLYMKLGNLDDAKACFTALHAKWLNGNLVTVKYIRDRRYAERFPFTANA